MDGSGRKEGRILHISAASALAIIVIAIAEMDARKRKRKRESHTLICPVPQMKILGVNSIDIKNLGPVFWPVLGPFSGPFCGQF